MKVLLCCVFFCSFIFSAPLSAQDFSGGEKTVPPQSAAMQAADEALEARDYAKAEKLLKPLVEADPRNVKLLYDLGSAEDALDQATAAEQNYRAAIAVQAGFLEPRVALGLMQARGGHLAEARETLVAAATVSNGETISDADKALRARALRALARIDEKTQPGVARDELLAALAISPETPEDTLLSAELAETAGNGKQAAEAAYRRLLSAHPNDPQATASLAHLLVEEKNFDQAEKLLQAGLEAHPQDDSLTIQLAAAYTAEGRTADALPLVEALHAANPNDANVAKLLAGLYVDQKQYAQAEPLLAPLCAGRPDDGGLADLRAQALLHLHRAPEAERSLTRVVAQPTDFASPAEWADAAADLAFAANENSEPEVVIQVLTNRAKVLPPSPPILFLTAVSHDKLHHVKAATQAYKDFLAASNGAYPNEDFEARHRLVALEHMK